MRNVLYVTTISCMFTHVLIPKTNASILEKYSLVFKQDVVFNTRFYTTSVYKQENKRDECD